MKFINRKTHAVLDYLMGIVLIVSPWLFGFTGLNTAKWFTIIIGIVILITSLMTDYEGGIISIIPMPAHLNMDAIAGILLIASPWLLRFYDRVCTPHIILGVLELGVAILHKSGHNTRPQLLDIEEGVCKRLSF